MEKLGVLFLMGPTDCNDPHIPAYGQEFLNSLSKELGREVACVPQEDWKKEQLHIFFIASGGAEPGFKKAFRDVKPPYVLLTVPAYNSLAAAMEIMGFLEGEGEKGEILHGDLADIAHRIRVLERVAAAKSRMEGMRLGAIGKPSGLISSEANAEKLQQASGMQIVDLELQELIEEYHKGGYEENDYTRALKAQGYDAAEVEAALNVYGAVERMVVRHNLQAVTVRCFDLLGLIHTTGCLALAILNAKGIPAACEGDTKSLISMVVSFLLTGQPSFMANPSCMDPEKGEIIFAHCTLPLNMPDRYTLTTHFESGIGVAVSGDVPAGPVTVFKCNDAMTRFYAGDAQLMESLHRGDLCRTQMRLALKDGTDYFAHRPISNHHMIVRGAWAEVFEEFFAPLQNSARQ